MKRKKRAVALAVTAGLMLVPGMGPDAMAHRKGKHCTKGYKPCLHPASDYDCAGGSGNGPKYVHGTVSVTGSDPYGIDSDSDGIGCE